MKNYKYNDDSKVYKRYLEYCTFEQGRELSKSDKAYCRKTFEGLLEMIDEMCERVPDENKRITLIQFLEDDKKFKRFKELNFSEEEMFREITGEGFEGAKLIRCEAVSRIDENEADEPAKCVIYARKSTGSTDRQVASLVDQLEIANDIAKTNSYEVVETFTESASAKRPNTCPILSKMVKKIESGEANAIICLNISRLPSSGDDSDIMRQLRMDGKIKFIHTAIGKFYVVDNDHLWLDPETITPKYISKL